MIQILNLIARKHVCLDHMAYDLQDSDASVPVLVKHIRSVCLSLNLTHPPTHIHTCWISFVAFYWLLFDLFSDLHFCCSIISFNRSMSLSNFHSSSSCCCSLYIQDRIISCLVNLAFEPEILFTTLKISTNVYLVSRLFGLFGLNVTSCQYIFMAILVNIIIISTSMLQYKQYTSILQF